MRLLNRLLKASSTLNLKKNCARFAAWLKRKTAPMHERKKRHAQGQLEQMSAY